jgi:hypothetical protein
MRNAAISMAILLCAPGWRWIRHVVEMLRQAPRLRPPQQSAPERE